jgi:predicted TIM-barrel fold metal-dependent hydrolase
MGAPDYGDPAWDPFWEVCTDLEIPISFHIGGGGMTGGIPSWPSLATLPGVRPMAVSALMLSFNNARVLVQLMYSGMMDRWPKLKFVSVESGIGWIPFFLEQATYQLEEFNTGDRWGLQRTPKEYFRDQMYACWWFEEHGPKVSLEEVGINNCLFETDYPHPTCLFPNSLQRAADRLAMHPYEVKKRVMQDNAAELWKIPV